MKKVIPITILLEVDEAAWAAKYSIDPAKVADDVAITLIDEVLPHSKNWQENIIGPANLG